MLEFVDYFHFLHVNIHFKLPNDGLPGVNFIKFNGVVFYSLERSLKENLSKKIEINVFLINKNFVKLKPSSSIWSKILIV